MSWVEGRRNLLRKELAGLEADVALCGRCYGDLPRLSARFDRPDGLPRVLILGERPPRRALEAGERLGLACADSGTRFLRELLDLARLDADDVLLGAACLCRAASPELERVVPMSTSIEECAGHVRELVRLAGPRLIVAAGAGAVRSLRTAFPESAAIAALRFPVSVGRTVDAGGVFVRCVHLPTVRGRSARGEAEQREDWAAIGALWHWIREGEGGPAPGA